MSGSAAERRQGMGSFLSSATPEGDQETEQRQRVVQPQPQVLGQAGVQAQSRTLVAGRLLMGD
jgi:hypothetical protein